MDHKKAIKKSVNLAIECIRKEIQRLAVDANLQEIYQANTPHTIAASKRRALLKEAILVLQGEPEQKLEKLKTRQKKPGAIQPDLFVE